MKQKPVVSKAWSQKQAAVDFNDIKYKDKQKENSRQKKLEVFRETGNWPGMKQKPVVSKAWSQKQATKEKRIDRKRKKEMKQKAAELENIEDENDLNDLEDDFRVLKKMKKGKVSHEEFDKRIDLDGLDTESENEV